MEELKKKSLKFPFLAGFTGFIFHWLIRFSPDSYKRSVIMVTLYHVLFVVYLLFGKSNSGMMEAKIGTCY